MYPKSSLIFNHRFAERPLILPAGNQKTAFCRRSLLLYITWIYNVSTKNERW